MSTEQTTLPHLDGQHVASAMVMQPACSQGLPAFNTLDAGLCCAALGSATLISFISSNRKFQQSLAGKIQEPSVSFILAESQRKLSLEHNKGYLHHRI